MTEVLLLSEYPCPGDSLNIHVRASRVIEQ